MADLLSGVTLLKKQDGELVEVLASTQLTGKVVGLYFSGHWCPPCRMFTPKLKAFYENVDRTEFEIVFLTCDSSEEDMKNYILKEQGDWCAIKYGDARLEELNEKYSVEGIPMLVIIKSDGSVITNEGREAVEKCVEAQAVLNEWKST